MQTSTMLWIVAVVLVLVGAGWYFYATTKTATAPTQTQLQGTTPTDQTQPQDTGTPADGASATVGATVSSAPMSAMVSYDGSKFTPSTVTIAKGGKVTFVGQDGKTMWVASDPHPTHEKYSGTTRTQHCPDTNGTAFDQCAVGNGYSFVFTKVGSWGYHDHLNHGATGTVVVQ